MNNHGNALKTDPLNHLDQAFVDREITAMEAQFPQSPEVVTAVGGVAVEAATGNWVAVGRARIPSATVLSPDAKPVPLTEALDADLARKAKSAGFTDYTVRYTREAEAMRQQQSEAEGMQRRLIDAQDRKVRLAKKKTRGSHVGPISAAD